MEDSSLGRAISVLLSPEKTFRSISERPTIAWVLVFLVLVGAGVNFLVYSKIDGAEMARFQIEQSGREITEQQMELATTMGEKLKYITPAVSIVLGPIFMLLLAAIFLVAFRLQGSDLSFKSSLSTSLHGMMPGAVKALLTIPVVLGRSEVDFFAAQTQTLLASNLGVLAPEDSSLTLTALLASADLFSIWMIILLALGYRIVAKVSGTTAGITVTVIWLLGVAFKIGMTAISG